MSRRARNSFSHSKSAPNLPRLDGFQTDRVVTPEEDTPRAAHASNQSILEYGTRRDEVEDDENEDFQPHYTHENQSSSSSSGSGSDDGPNVESPRPFFHRSNSSFLNSFAPPFYNRPPTPLPPSPSLTSLLRPTFSATPSRPTTPDSSENDTPNDTEAAVAKSARTATTVPRASPKVPTYEYYGFVLYLVSSLCFCRCRNALQLTLLTTQVMYLLWSYLPSPFLHQLGIYYYPNRWWSLAIPSFLVMTIVYIYVALATYNTEYLTLPMSSIENIVDEAANVAAIDSYLRGKGKSKTERHRGYRSSGIKSDNHDEQRWDWTTLWSEGTNAVMDVPVGGVCEILYGDAQETEQINE
ncbi:MAG: hypothetical protein MMC33_005539 [Icmadophila ericetorum]|nr:hypothetical protein [Icmadophila ericetorum]